MLCSGAGVMQAHKEMLLLLSLALRSGMCWRCSLRKLALVFML